MDEGTAAQELTGQDYETVLDGMQEARQMREDRGLSERPGPAGTAVNENTITNEGEKE